MTQITKLYDQNAILKKLKQKILTDHSIYHQICQPLLYLSQGLSRHIFLYFNFQPKIKTQE